MYSMRRGVHRDSVGAIVGHAVAASNLHVANHLAAGVVDAHLEHGVSQ